MGISVIIPTYKEPNHLRLCIDSALRSLVDLEDEILVWVDGTGNLPENKAVIDFYKENKFVYFFISDVNRGMCVGMNELVRRARNNYCLIVNDDHVFPRNWDLEIAKYTSPHRILVFNTIERIGSMFMGVEIQDFGTDPGNFKLEEYLAASYDPTHGPVTNGNICRLPFLINKWDYLALEGWDEQCIHGLQADDDFFLRAKIVGHQTWFIPQLKFYHFSMTSVNNNSLVENGKQSRTEAEQKNIQYLYWKWGGNVPRHNGTTVQLFNPLSNQVIIE